MISFEQYLRLDFANAQGIGGPMVRKVHAAIDQGGMRRGDIENLRKQLAGDEVSIDDLEAIHTTLHGRRSRRFRNRRQLAKAIVRYIPEVRRG